MSSEQFPSSYLLSLQTALGPAWPRPRVRRVMENLENVQKRMTLNKQLRDGIMYTPKNMRQERFDGLVSEFKAMERELDRLMKMFERMPATKEQFKRPDVDLSVCHDAYIKPLTTDLSGPQLAKDTFVCVECGEFCETYKRLEREDWNKDYADALQDEQDEVQKKADEEVPIKKPAAPSGIQGGYLIT